MKISSLTLLVLLTLTLVAYNYQFYNIPSYMFLNAYNLAQKHVTEFRLTLPSAGIPHEYRDVTEDDQFRTQVIDYVTACDVTRTGMEIKEYDTPYQWLKNASNSTEGYDMTITFFNDSYFLQVRYYLEFQRTPLEHQILWAINAVTIVAWLSVIVAECGFFKRSASRSEGQKENRKGGEKASGITIVSVLRSDNISLGFDSAKVAHHSQRFCTCNSTPGNPPKMH